MDKKKELYKSLLIKKKIRGLEDLLYFNKYVLENDEKRRDLLVPHVHGEWIDWYKNSEKRIKMILVPRATFKSTFFTVGKTLQAICQDRDARILIANATLGNSQKFLGEIKNHLRKNTYLRELYGGKDGFYDKNLKWNEDEIEILGRTLGAREPTVTAAGVGGNLVSQHYSMIIADDLMNLENSSTRYQVDKVIDWWKRAFSLLDYDGELIVIGTRWSYYDLYSYIEDNFQDQADIYIRGAYKEDGSLYFPELLSEDKLEELKGLQGSYVFCNPKEAPVLMADWTFKPISEVVAGDVVVGWKREESGRRSLCRSEVLETGSRKADVVKMKMESGREVRCTSNHNWYTARHDKTHKEYKPATVGSKLMFILDPEEYKKSQDFEEKEDQLRDAAWLGGLYDGDGGFSGGSIFYAQDYIHNKEVCDKLEDALTNLGYDYGSGIRKIKKGKDKRGIIHSVDMRSYWLKGGLEEKVRFIRECKPSKAHRIADRIFSKGGRFVKEKDEVLEITPDGNEEVFALQTETGNYVVWGYGSSNSSFYLNDPVDEESALIKKEQIKYWGEGEHKLPKHLNYFTVCDPAVSQATTADESSIIVVGVDPQNDWYVAETRSGKWTVGQLIEELFAVHAQWKPYNMSIEVIGQAQGIMTPIHDEENRRNRYLPLTEIKARPQVRKEIRIRSVLQPRFERGKIFIKKDMYQLEEQLLKFPRSKRDDMIDALTDVEDISFPAEEPETEVSMTGNYFQDVIRKKKFGLARPVDKHLGENY